MGGTLRIPNSEYKVYQVGLKDFGSPKTSKDFAFFIEKPILSHISLPEDSSLEKKIPLGGKFFAGVFFVRIILRGIILR
jgi:hypothetical protein